MQQGFLKTLKTLLPDGVRPLILTDAGFRGPWFKAVQALGWDWIGRVRNRTYVRGEREMEWVSCKTLYAKASPIPKALEVFEQVRSAPLMCALYLVRKKKQGRVKKTLMGDRARSKHKSMSYLLLAFLYLGINRAETAERYIADAVGICTDFYLSVDILRSNIALARRDFDTACSNFKHVVEVDPYRCDIWYALSVAYEQAGELKQAITCCKRGLSYVHSNVALEQRLVILSSSNGRKR